MASGWSYSDSSFCTYCAEPWEGSPTTFLACSRRFLIGALTLPSTSMHLLWYHPWANCQVLDWVGSSDSVRRLRQPL
jgi:hypothetical protein